MARTFPDKALTAFRFTIVLSEWLTPSQFREMKALNALEPEGSKVCHSHDHCDANMAMLEAMSAAGLTEGEVCSDDPEISQFWNDVWSFAFKEYLS